MLNERILKNKEFFVFKSLKENFKSDIISDLRPKVQTEPIKKLNDLKVSNLNKQIQQKSPKYIVAQPINIEPVDSNLFFASSLLNTKQKNNVNGNIEKVQLTKEEFELTTTNNNNCFTEDDNNNKSYYPPSISPEKLSKKIRKKKKKQISKKSSSRDLKENQDLHNTPSPSFISKEQSLAAQNSNKKEEEEVDLLHNKCNIFNAPEIFGNSLNPTTVPLNSLSCTSSSSTTKISQINDFSLNSKPSKNNKNNKKNKNNNRSNNGSNTFHSHNNESFVDLPNIKSQDYDSNYRNSKISNKQQEQCLLETESISKAGFSLNNKNNNNLSETINKPPLLPKNNEYDKSEKFNEKGNQSSLPILKEATTNKSTTLLKTVEDEEAFLDPIKAPSTRKLSRKMKLINNLTENKSSLMSDTCNNTESNINYTGSNNSALKFLNCLEKNKKLLKKFYENIDWDKIKEEDESKRIPDQEIELEFNEINNNDTMKLQLKEKAKNYYQGNNNPYRSSGGIISGIGSPSSKGLHWINIATTNTGIKRANFNSKSENSSGNAAKEIIRIINNVTSMSVDSAGLTNSTIGTVASQGIETIMSPSSENFNTNITISTISPKNNPVNKLHFLKVDGQRVDYLHSIQSNGVSRKSQSSFGIQNQGYKMSFAKASSVASSTSNSTNSTPSTSASSSSTNATILVNGTVKKNNTKIIDLSNYRNITNLDFIKQAVRENFDGKDNIKLPDLSTKNVDSSILLNPANSDKEVFEQANSSTSSNKTTNLTENDLLEYFKNKRKAKTQNSLFLKLQNAHQRTNTNINNFIRGETALNLNDDLIVMSNEHLDKDRHSESPPPLSPSTSSMNVSANLINFSNRTNKLKKRLNRIRNKSINQNAFSVSVGTNTYPASKKFFTDPISVVTSASKDAKVVKEIRNMYETSLNKSDFNNNLDNSINDNTAANINTNTGANLNSGRLIISEDIDKNRSLFNLSRNEVIDIINNSQDTKDIDHRDVLIKNSRCSYNNSHIDNENSREEDLNVTSIIRELKENEFKESIKIEKDEIEDKRKNAKSAEFSLGLNIDSIASKLLVFDMENIPNSNLNKESTQNKIELEKPNEIKESSNSSAPKFDHESNKTVERRMSKIDNEKIISPSISKDQPKISKTSNSTKFSSTNLIQKLSITSKKFKNSSASLTKYTDVDPTKLPESPLSKSRRIYTKIANSSIQPLNEEFSDENDLDLNISEYQLLPHKENEFIKKQLEADRLQRKIFKKLLIEKSSYSHPNSLISPSVANFNSSSVLNNYTNQNKLNIYDCYKYYERTKIFE